jgi:hypothetical protein
MVVAGRLRWISAMTGNLRTLPPAALAFGAAGMTALDAVPEGIATLLVAAVVAIAGIVLAGVGEPVSRGAGIGLTVLGAHLVGVAVVTVTAVGTVFYLLPYGLPLVAFGAFAVRGVLACATGAGLLLPVVALQVREIGATSGSVAGTDGAAMAAGMLVAAALLTVAVVVAPDRAWWGHLAGAAAATAATVAYGAGTAPVVALITFQWPAVAPPGGQVAIMTGALAVAAVLALLAAVRRDVVTGLVAATVFVAPVTDAVTRAVTGLPVTAPVHAVLAAPLAVVVLVALLAVRMYPMRGRLAEVPRALRDRRPTSATTTAVAAAVVACGLVAFTVQALPALGVDGGVQGALSLAALLVAGALAHFLPAPAGPVAAVVTLVGFTVAQPWDRLLDARGASAPVDAVTAAVVILLLVRRHPRPAVFAAAAYLVLGTLARLIGLAGDSLSLVALLLPLLAVGLPAAVLTWHDRTVEVGQAVGAVVLGAAMYVPMKQLLLAYLAQDRVTGVFDPFVPTTGYHLHELGWPVALVLVVLASVLVASVVRRPSTAIVVTAALLVFCAGRVAGLLVADTGLLAGALGVLAVALAAGAWFASRRA